MTRNARHAARHADETYGRRQPRPRPRRTGTRRAVVAAAISEG